MDAQQFAYWLQGYAELHSEPPSAEQWQSIREHLATVFKKVTPPVGIPTELPPSKYPESLRWLDTTPRCGIVKRDGDNQIVSVC